MSCITSFRTDYQATCGQAIKRKTRIVHCLLLVGLYQLLYTRIPAHAAVDEVVNATTALKVEHFRGLVNGVLRRFYVNKKPY